MAKSSPTFQKRLRENKVREKARLKREQKLERREEKKRSPAVEGQEFGEFVVLSDDETEGEFSAESGAEQDAGN